jgi:phenylalanyl-tRNA synthetase beta chain
VFLECAFFSPASIAGTARRYGLQTDASYRYERGVDFELQRAAVEHATRLLVSIAGGRPGPVVETRDEAALPQRARVTLRQRRLEELLGVAMDAVAVDALLARLGFDLLSRVESEKGIVWTVQPPSHRFDISIEADLVEEVCRIHGYDRIPGRTPDGAVPLRRVPLERSPEIRLKRMLATAGLQEVITYSFVDPVLQDLLDPGAVPLALENPMSAELSVMRTSLLPGLAGALTANAARQQDRVRIFETGLVFRAGATLQQTPMVGGVVWGRRDPESWHGGTARTDFFDVKGIVEQIVEWSGIRASYERLDDPVLHPGQAAALQVDGRTVGRLGRLHPEIEHRLGVDGVHLFELELEAVLERPARRQAELSRFPSVRRDLALVVADGVRAGDLESTVREVLGRLLVDFRLFDVYRGKGIDSTEKSVALGLTLQNPSATLTDADITGHVHAVLAALADRWGARLRSS